MTPRNDVEALRRRQRQGGASATPARPEPVAAAGLGGATWTNIIGVLATRDILAPALMNEPFDLRALLREAAGRPATGKARWRWWTGCARPRRIWCWSTTNTGISRGSSRRWTCWKPSRASFSRRCHRRAQGGDAGGWVVPDRGLDAGGRGCRPAVAGDRRGPRLSDGRRTCFSTRSATLPAVGQRLGTAGLDHRGRRSGRATDRQSCWCTAP